MNKTANLSNVSMTAHTGERLILTGVAVREGVNGRIEVILTDIDGDTVVLRGEQAQLDRIGKAIKAFGSATARAELEAAERAGTLDEKGRTRLQAFRDTEARWEAARVAKAAAKTGNVTPAKRRA